MKKIILFLLCAGVFVSLRAQEKQEGILFLDNAPWAEVLQKAKAGNKLIFMDCYTTWCGPCKALSEKIFPQKEVGEFFNANFINTKYDMEKGEGKTLYDRYVAHIPGFPTLLLIDADGEVVHQMAGYMEADKLIEGMRAGLEGNSLFAIAERYDSGQRDLKTVTAYVNALKAAAQQDRENEVINGFIGNMADFAELENPEVWSLVGAAIRDPYSPIFKYVVEHIDKQLPSRAGADRYKLESQLERAISSAIREIIRISGSSKNADTLSMMKDRAEYLKEMLVLNNVKRFPDHMAKLLMFGLMQDGKPVELFNDLGKIRKTGLLRAETYFLADCYAYIIDNVKDKKIVRASLDELLAVQGPWRENPSGMSNNFYDKIARGYLKLNDRAEAAKAREEFEKRTEITREYLKEMFPGLVK